MAGPEFFETKMGQRFYEVTAPRIADEMANLANAVNALVALLRNRARAAPAAPTTMATTEPRKHT